MSIKFLTISKKFILLAFFITTISFLYGNDRSAQVDGLFEKWDGEKTPGAAVAVIHKGEALHLRGYGMADLEHRIPIANGSVFNIGSVSKQFTAFCFALLENDGKISLDDDIRKHIPEIPDYGKKITLRHLVYHTSGLRDHQMLIYLGGREASEWHSAGEVISQILKRQKKLNFDPGKKFAYCNSGYLLLGEIIKRISGKSLNDFAQQNLFVPLGMKDTFFLDNFRKLIEDRAWSYIPDGKGRYNIYLDRYDLVGDSGVYTTIEDMILWTQNYFSSQVGGADVIEKVLSPGKLDSGKSINYSFGLEHGIYKGLKTIKHDGMWGGYSAMSLLFPEKQFSVICLTNNAVEINSPQLSYRIADIFLGDSFKAESKQSYQIIPLPTDDLELMTGAYRSPSNANLMKVSRQDGSLICDVNGFFKAEYAPFAQYEFKCIKPDIPSVFRFVKRDDSDRFSIHTYRLDERTNVYENIELFSPSTKELKEFEGDYYSEELDNTYSFFVKNERLFVSYAKAPNRSPRGPLTPTIQDEFAAWPSVYHFQRNEENEISGFILGTDLKHGLSFKRIE